MRIKANIKTIIERIIEKFEGYINTVEEDFEEDEIILKPYDTDFLDDIINEEKEWWSTEMGTQFNFSEKDEDDLYDILFTKTELFGNFENQYNGLPLTINSMQQTIKELEDVLGTSEKTEFIA